VATRMVLEDAAPVPLWCSSGRRCSRAVAYLPTRACRTLKRLLELSKACAWLHVRTQFMALPRRPRRRSTCGSDRRVMRPAQSGDGPGGGSQRGGNHRAAASALSSGRVLKAMAASGAPRCMALITASKSTRCLGGRRTPAPMTTQL